MWHERLPIRPRLSVNRTGKCTLATRRVGFETLEKRAMLIAEAEPFNLSKSFQIAGLVGVPTASFNWGDGSQPSIVAITGGATTGSIKIRFDYSLDTTGFVASSSRRTLLDAAAAMVTSRMSDNLTAIQPSGSNTWTASTLHPVTNTIVNFPNLKIAANEIVVYVGARELGGNQLGVGGPGGLGANGDVNWLNTVAGRGQAGALASPKTDIGPWGGTLAFDITTNWFFGLDQSALQPGQQDFVTVAAHELMHLLGFGTAESWTNLKSGATFTGPKSRAAYDAGGNVPLSADGSHWRETVTDAGRPTIMGPVIDSGERDTLTGLDLAGLDDIGWDFGDINANISASHIYADNGTYPITVTYRGSTVGLFTDTATANITNALPTLAVADNQSVKRDQVLNLTNIGSILDPGFANPAASPPTSETFKFTVNWGDGTTLDTGDATIDRIGNVTAPTLASFNGSHTYSSTGTFTVTLAVTDDDQGTVQKTFQVAVTTQPQLSLELNRTSISENATGEAATLTIRRTAPAATSEITINLVSSDTSEATIPTSIVIPAGELSVTVPVSAVDDAILDGTQQVTLTASGAGLLSGTTSLSVTDLEELVASFTAAAIFENAAANSFFLTVTRPDNGAAVTINISGNVPTELNVPTTATIEAGSREVRIPIEPINDTDPEKSLSLVYQVTATGYVSDEGTLVLIDDEPPLFQNLTDRFDVDGRGDVLPLDALRIINLLARRKQNFDLDPETEVPNGVFPDVNGDYRVSALDALQVINEIAKRLRRASTSGEEKSDIIVAAPQLENRNRATSSVDATVDSAITQLF